MAEPLHEILVKATLADMNGGNVTRVERGYLQIKDAFNASSNAWSSKANMYEGSYTALPTGNELWKGLGALLTEICWVSVNDSRELQETVCLPSGASIVQFPPTKHNNNSSRATFPAAYTKAAIQRHAANRAPPHSVAAADACI